MFKKFFILLSFISILGLSFQSRLNAYPDGKIKDFSSLGTFDFDINEQRSCDIDDFLDFSKSFYQTPIDFLILGDSEKRDFLKVKEYLTNISYRIYWSDFFSRFSLEGYPVGYKEVRSFAVELLRRHYEKLSFSVFGDPSDRGAKNIYVFIGTSPIAPVLAFLETLRAHSSDIKDGKIKESLERSIFIDIPYSVSLLNDKPPLTEEEMFQHFSRYVNPDIIERNNLIVVDVAKSGVNVGSFIRLFKKYLSVSKVKEYSFAADIFTFFSPELYNGFLKKLSTYPDINVQYSNKYFSFLMRNLYINEYDDAFLDYYDFFFNDMKRSMYISFYGDSLYKEALFDREFLYFYGESVYLNKINSIYEPFLVYGKYVDSWRNYIRSDKKATIDKRFEHIKEVYGRTIEKDSFFKPGSFCIRLFGGT